MAGELGPALDRLWQVIQSRRGGDAASSYTARLFARGRAKIAQKLGEEAVETAVAAVARDGRLAEEAADLVYHLYVLLAVAGVDVAEVEDELARRAG
jgi:phosphoribosyl-ATP pyrophosphohydrolase